MRSTDPYGELLEPPKEPSKEYAAFDGGVDLSRIGFSRGVQTRKAIRRRDGTEDTGHREGQVEFQTDTVEASGKS